MEEIMEENKIKNNPEVIDLRVVFKKIWEKRKLFLKIWAIVFVVSCIYILGVPRYYTTEVKLAPEMENGLGNSTLGSMASSFGFDLGNMQTSDAITPLLYPDLMEDNGFVYSLMNIKVVSQDGEINTNYHDYLKSHQKKSIWSYPLSWLKNLLPKSKDMGGGKAEYDPYNLSRDENSIYESARKNINASVDKQNGVITLSITSQDALISRTLADSVKDKLQIFITQYRTNKARNDYEYYKNLTSTAKQEYEKVRRYYASLADASTNVRLRSIELKIEDVENDMQLKYNTYTTLNAQLQAAKAKVQERTPAFTVIKGASVPIKASGPKRMLFVLGMLVLATFIEIFWVTKEEIHL